MSGGGTQDEPVMDGALDDMSDGGTSKVEASTLMEDAGVHEVPVDEQSVGDDIREGIEEGRSQA